VCRLSTLHEPLYEKETQKSPPLNSEGARWQALFYDDGQAYCVGGILMKTSKLPTLQSIPFKLLVKRQLNFSFLGILVIAAAPNLGRQSLIIAQWCDTVFLGGLDSDYSSYLRGIGC
jgi:hypothetical protein